MKRLTSRRRANPTAFTLVELLVVIGIIAILAAAVLGISGNVIKQAKKAKAANTATQIQTACLGYYTEYSVYPVPSTATASTDYLIADSGAAAETSWANLTVALCGMINPYNANTISASTSIPANTRSIAFLSMKASDVDANGAPLNPLPTVSGGTTNNAYFNIAIDNDYDGILGGTSTATSANKLPNFAVPQTGTGPSATPVLSGSSTAGVAVWANCNNSTSISALNNWVHTY